MMKLMNTLYRVIGLMVCLSALSGCIEEYEADITEEDSDLLVVEGTICSDKLNKFTLSRTQSIGTTHVPQMLTGARVSVIGSDGSEYVAQWAGGYYACQIGPLSPDAEYLLHIEVDGEVYESAPQLPLRTEKIADVRGVQNTPESDIDVLITPEVPFESGEAKYYSWTYDETWEVHPDFKTVMYYDTEKLEPAYTSNQFPERGWLDARGTTIMVGTSTSYASHHIEQLKLYSVDRSDSRMYYRYSGLVHQRAISKAEYEYELARRQAGSEMGGLFTPLPSALPTNIRCLTSGKRVIGYVGCSLNTSEYRFFLNPNEYSIRMPMLSDTRVWIDNPSEADCLEMVRKGFFLCEWVTPLMSDDGQLHAVWAYLYQLDVRARYDGAYIEEPDFWSLEENVSY